MTKRAERVYLSFYESNGADNAPRLARAIRQLIKEGMEDPNNIHSLDRFLDKLYDIADELEDPNLLNGIYGNCYD
jgi:hypothetical protein